MRVVTLEYHDVVQPGMWDGSGFPGNSAGRYKLTVSAFREHLERVSRAVTPRAETVEAVLARGRSAGPLPVLFTFDDGGSSAYEATAGLLEEAGWRGHFLVTTDYIGRPAFLAPAQLRELRARGHVIGSHSCSHPLRMSSCTPARLRDEWRRSAGRLGDILGEGVTVASVPGGGYDRAVARAAAEAGIRALFTSEPVTRTHEVDGCTVLGRYTLVRGTPAARAARMAAGDPLARGSQWAGWNAKKVAKRCAGPLYLKLRGIILDGEGIRVGADQAG